MIRATDNMKSIKIFDFDGTLIDLWPRYHAVFCDLTGSNVTLNKYKTIKRQLKRDEDVAVELGAILPQKYFERKAELLEDIEYLKLDKLFFNSDEMEDLLSGDTLILTKRRNEENFKLELDWLGINCDYKVVTIGSKEEWIKANIHCKAIAVGDSVADIVLGRQSGVTVIGVGYGLCCEQDFDSVGVEYKYIDSSDKLLETIIECE